MDIENKIINLNQFHRTFKHIKSEERMVAELNAANLLAEWDEVTIEDCHTVLKDLAEADLSQGGEFYAMAVALLSTMVYQNVPLTDKLKYVNRILSSDMLPQEVRKKANDGWTVGEMLMEREISLVKEKGRENKFKWQNFKLGQMQQVQESCFNEDTAVYLVEPDEGIYAYKDRNGTVVLTAKVNQTEDILAGEEMMNNEVPYYYTPSTHFISPVWKLRAMKKAIQETCSFLEFPVVPIRFQIILPLKEQRFIDEEKLWKKDWKNLPLKIIYGKEKLKQCTGCSVWPMHETWEYILAAAAKLYPKFKQKPNKVY